MIVSHFVISVRWTETLSTAKGFQIFSLYTDVTWNLFIPMKRLIILHAYFLACGGQNVILEYTLAWEHKFANVSII
jgi:hypothetical protein